MDIDDNDTPPELVEAGHETGEEKPVKVPITIVTGTFIKDKYQTILYAYVCITRVFGSWKNHASELHIDSAPWQENRCDHE